MRSGWVRAAGIVAVVAVLGLSACSPGKDPGVVKPSGSSSAAPSGAVPVTKVNKTGINEPPALADGATSVILDVRPTKCESGPGKVVAAGTVSNHADEARDIVVTAAWTTPDNSKTFAKAAAVLKQVPAGQERGYEITSDVKAPKDTAIVCTFAAMSGTLK